MLYYVVYTIVGDQLELRLTIEWGLPMCWFNRSHTLNGSVYFIHPFDMIASLILHYSLNIPDLNLMDQSVDSKLHQISYFPFLTPNEMMESSSLTPNSYHSLLKICSRGFHRSLGQVLRAYGGGGGGRTGTENHLLQVLLWATFALGNLIIVT